MALLNLVLLLSLSVANETKIEKPVMEFMACAKEYQKSKDIEASRKCIDPLLSSSLDQDDRDRLSAFALFKPTDFKTRNCNESDSQREKFFSEKTNHKVCVHFKLGKESKSGIVFLIRENADFKIKSLFY